MDLSKQSEEAREVNLVNDLDKKLNISGTSADYFTPNETVKTDANSINVFLEKLQQAIDEPTDSSYVTALDQSHKLKDHKFDTLMAKFIKNSDNEVRESQLLENIQQTLVENTVILSSDEDEDKEICKERYNLGWHSYLAESSSLSNSSDVQVIEIHDSSEASSSSLEIEFPVKTGVDGSVDHENNNQEHLNEKSNMSINSMYDENMSPLRITGSNQYCRNMSVIPSDNDCKLEKFSSVESIDEKSEIEDIIIKLSRELRDSEDPTENKECLDYTAEPHPNLSQNESSQKEIILRYNTTKSDPNLSQREMNPEKYADSSSTASETANTHSQSDFDPLELVHVDVQDNSAEKFQLPKINIECYESFEENSSSNSVVFNDTLEEMEMALKHGLNYKMPTEEEENKEFLSCTQHKNNDLSSSLNSEGYKNLSISSETSSAKDVSVFSSSESETHIPRLISKKKRIPTTKIENKDKNISPLNFKPKLVIDNFKMPNNPNKLLKTALMKSPALKTTVNTKKSPSLQYKYKNIVSPVAVYIKNSPAAVLKQNVVTKELPYLKIEKNIGFTKTPEIMKNQVTPSKCFVPQNLFEEVIVAKHESKKKSDVNLTSFKENKFIQAETVSISSPGAIKKNAIPQQPQYFKDEKECIDRVLKNIENTELPEVVYKPAKKNIIKEEKGTELPKSLQKFVHNATSTTHVSRYNVKTNGATVREKLMQGEVTCSSINESMFSGNVDVSILINKKELIN